MAKKKEKQKLDFESLMQLDIHTLTKVYIENHDYIESTLYEDEVKALNYTIFINLSYENDLSIFEDIEAIELKIQSMHEAFHKNLSNSIAEFIDDTGNSPPIHYMANSLKVDARLIQLHLDNFEESKYLKSGEQFEKIAVDKLKKRILRRALNGDLQAAKLYLTHIEKSEPPQPQATPQTVNNFIQINNILINQNTIQSLPESKQKAIEEIILTDNLEILPAQ